MYSAKQYHWEPGQGELLDEEELDPIQTELPVAGVSYQTRISHTAPETLSNVTNAIGVAGYTFFLASRIL